MDSSVIAPLYLLAIYAVAAGILYWVIRLAVRHAIKDADDRRSRTRS